MAALRVAVNTGRPTTGPAGPRRYVSALCQALSDRSADLHLVPLAAPVDAAVGRRAWDVLGAPLAARHAAVDVLHCPGIYPPLRLGVPVVLTVHDLAIRRLPQVFPPMNRTLGWWAWRRLARRADQFIAVSASTGRDLVALLDVDAERVHVVPHGVTAAFQPCHPPQVQSTRRRYALAEDYFLALGTVEPRKNLERTIAAFQHVRQTHPSLSLVVVGAPGWGTRQLLARLTSGVLGPSVHYLGAVPDADLAALYSGALALVYPSLFEGFGMPVAEAMACGCPVVTSGRGGLEELANGATLRVDPLSVADIAAAMSRVAHDEPLRAALRSRGLARAARLTWGHAAERTVAVYRLAVEMEPAGARP